MTYDDHRLAAIYDADNFGGVDHDYFRALADRPGVRRIVDLGCGTGSLTVTLTGPGTSERIDPDSADLVIMSANVSMHLVGDAWPATLANVARGLVAGGTLAFESRNPAAEAWRTWNEQATERDTAVGRLRESTNTGPPDDDGVVIKYSHNDFLDAGGILDVEQRLQFRSAEQIVVDLETAGLKPQSIWRDWHHTPFTGIPGEHLMIFEVMR